MRLLSSCSFVGLAISDDASGVNASAADYYPSRPFMVPEESARHQAAKKPMRFTSLLDDRQFGRQTVGVSRGGASDHLPACRIVVPIVSESDARQFSRKGDNAKEVAKRFGLISAMATHGLRKVLADFRTASSMGRFCDSADGLWSAFAGTLGSANRNGGGLWSRPLRRADDSATVAQKIGEFAAVSRERYAILCNSQVVQDGGCDLPPLDAVCLLEPRVVPLAISRIMGLAIRGPGVSTVVSPVCTPTAVDSLCDRGVRNLVGSGEFAVVLDVLAALSSHDERIEAWLRSFGRLGRTGFGRDHPPVDIRIDAPCPLRSKLMAALESRIAHKFGQLEPRGEIDHRNRILHPPPETLLRRRPLQRFMARMG